LRQLQQFTPSIYKTLNCAQNPEADHVPLGKPLRTTSGKRNTSWEPLRKTDKNGQKKVVKN